MGRPKQYLGYQSFDYLEKGKDFKEYILQKEENAFEPYSVPLSPKQEEEVLRLARNLVMISLHEHPHIFPADIRETPEYERQVRIFTAYAALSESYWDAVFDNFMDGTAMITSKHGWKWDDIIYDLGMRFCDLAHQDFIIKCEKVEDILASHQMGRIALVTALEASTMIENELDRIEILYGFGVRMMGITYSESNCLGSGLREPRDGGLTSFGHQSVERMNKIGMAIDCSHSSDQTILDTIAASRKPIFLSHTGARALWNIRRLAPDRVLKSCADKGGVIGVEAAPHTTLTAAHPLHHLDGFMEHFEYILDLVGEDHVAFGPDTLYGDHVGLHHVFAEALSIGQAHQNRTSDHSEAPIHTEVPYVKGIENPTEGSKNILRWLVGRNYSQETIAKVMGGNILRALKEVWQ